MPVVNSNDGGPDVEATLTTLEETRLARIAIEVLDTRLPRDLVTAELTQQLWALSCRLDEKERDALHAMIIVPFRKGNTGPDVLTALATLVANGLTIRLI